MEDETKTPRICEACGGLEVGGERCSWCSYGYQNEAQQISWKRFRNLMTKISGSYEVLETIIQDVITRLSKHGAEGDEAAWMLRDRGEEILKSWLKAEPTTDARTEATQQLLAFNREALDYLLKNQ